VERALFDLTIDSKLSDRDLVKIRISDRVSCAEIRMSSIVIWRKTGGPLQCELTADLVDVLGDANYSRGPSRDCR
jgi:hypothetical protein